MKIDLADIDKFITSHACKQVTNPVYFDMGSIPTEDGLFSPTIFGYPGSKERKIIWGYIDLKRKFLQPMMYKLFTSMDKKIEDMILGKRYFVVKNGELVEDRDKGKTGVTYFYSIYDQLTFKNTGSDRRTDYLKLIKKLSKDDIFVDKWLVCPAYYRDYNPSKTVDGKIDEVDEVNDMYTKLIRYSNSLQSGNDYDFMSAVTEASMQTTLFEIYNYFTDSIAKKNGLIHKSLLGKSVDYATRGVISAPRIKSEKWNENPVPFGYMGIPLSQVIVLFYPFFVKYIQDYIAERETDIVSAIDPKSGKPLKINLMEQFTEDIIKKKLSLYIKSVESRFDILTVKDTSGNEYPIDIYKEDLGRSYTLTDLLYIAAVDICKDKHVYVTRYPVEQYQNIFPAKIKILSTKETKPQQLKDRYLPDYPIIIPDYPASEELFIDSVVPNNSYLAALGGDYDGDTVSIRAVFSTEANKEAEELIYQKKNILDQMGRNSRKLGNEAIQAMYTLTRE